MVKISAEETELPAALNILFFKRYQFF